MKIVPAFLSAKSWHTAKPSDFYLPSYAQYISKSRPDYKDMAATLKLHGYTKSRSEVYGVAKFVK